MVSIAEIVFLDFSSFDCINSMDRSEVAVSTLVPDSLDTDSDAVGVDSSSFDRTMVTTAAAFVASLS